MRHVLYRSPIIMLSILMLSILMLSILMLIILMLIILLAFSMLRVLTLAQELPSLEISLNSQMEYSRLLR